jgi:Fumarylacetoacetate (FAA) hydrolase family
MAQRSGKHYFSQRTEWSAARLNVASSCDHWKQVEDRVTTDEVPDPHSLNIKLTIGGKLLQLSNTRELIFRIPDLITYISSITPLQPGDIISTGTPSGVGLGRIPHRWLRPGEIIITEIEGIGQLINPVIAEATTHRSGLPAAWLSCVLATQPVQIRSRTPHVSSHHF